MRVGGPASAPPHPSVRGFADAGMTTPAAPLVPFPAGGEVGYPDLQMADCGDGRRHCRSLAPVTPSANTVSYSRDYCGGRLTVFRGGCAQFPALVRRALQ
jgi:hypothetical protein